MAINSESQAAGETTSASIKSAVGDLSETATHQAHGLAEKAKGEVASHISGVASALREAASGLSGGSVAERSLGHIAHSFADASEFIQGKDLGELVTDASDLAKRNPVVFVGGAIFLGFAAARFLKASSHGGSSFDTTLGDRGIPS